MAAGRFNIGEQAPDTLPQIPPSLADEWDVVRRLAAQHAQDGVPFGQAIQEMRGLSFASPIAESRGPVDQRGDLAVPAGYVALQS